MRGLGVGVGGTGSTSLETQIDNEALESWSQNIGFTRIVIKADDLAIIPKHYGISRMVLGYH